jgi:hypothetical protein
MSNAFGDGHCSRNGSKGSTCAGCGSICGEPSYPFSNAPRSAEPVRKRKNTWFSCVVLPFPHLCQANTAQSDGSIVSSSVLAKRFHTGSARKRHST